MLLVLSQLAAFAAVTVDPHQIRSAPPAFVPSGVLDEDQASMVADELAALGTLYVSDTVDGFLYEVELRGTARVRGVPCRGSVHVLPDGSWTCELRAPWSVGGLTLPTEAWLRFAVGSGQLIGWSEPGERTTVLSGVPCAGEVEIGDDGDLRGCMLARAHSFRGSEAVPAGAKVELEGGRLQGAELRTDGGRTVHTYDPRGRVVRTEDVGAPD